MEFVKSHYRARWIGIVLERKSRTYYNGRFNDLLVILIVRTATGSIPRKRIVTTLDESWTTPIKDIDISMINSDWFK